MGSFTPALRDIPSEHITRIENRTALTADDAANWPVPPWSSPDFVEPVRTDSAERRIVEQGVTKYPEMFARAETNLVRQNSHKKQMALAEQREKGAVSMRYEER